MQNLSDNPVPSSENFPHSSFEAIAGGLAERGFAMVEQFLPAQAVAELRAVLIDAYRCRSDMLWYSHRQESVLL